MSHLKYPGSMFHHSEDLVDERVYTDEEMEELSDSHSSRPSVSRPITPHSHVVLSALNEPLSLALKAEKILGLIPGTLAHAQACLQNARDKVRWCNSESPPPTTFQTVDIHGGVRGKIDRACRAMSFSMPPGNQHTANGGLGIVVVGTGGKEEEDMREKRRRAADGVLYWQKEVARLEQDDAKERVTTVRKRG